MNNPPKLWERFKDSSGVGNPPLSTLTGTKFNAIALPSLGAIDHSFLQGSFASCTIKKAIRS